jgi:hypothetical protein
VVLARETSDGLTSLVKKLDSITYQFGDRGLDTYIIFCSDETGMEAKVKKLVEKEEIAYSGVSLTRSAGPTGYKFPKDAEATAMLFVKQSAKLAYTFGKGELTSKKADEVIDAIDAKTEKPFPIGYVAPAYAPRKALSGGGNKEAAGPNPNILIFAREMSEPLATIARRVDELARDKANELDSFVVLVGEDRKLEASLTEMAKKNALRNTTLSAEPANRVRAFRVSKENDITVFVCANGGSRGYYTFKVSDFKEQSCDKMLTELKSILQKAK